MERKTMAGALANIKLLVADADARLCNVLTDTLGTMGFSQVETTGSGHEAAQKLQKNTYDMLITDWNLADFDGIALIDFIRSDPRSLDMALPIVMLTGRAEQNDVLRARDHGVTEYAVKPFTAQSLFSRLERVVDFPKPFIVSQKFTGPERRARTQPSGAERRKIKLVAERRPWDVAPVVDIPTPKYWLPDFSLKQKLGMHKSLAAAIPPMLIGKAQASIDAASADALAWIKADFEHLSAQSRAEGDAAALGEAALMFSTRAGTFGYKVAAEVAYMLHLFCCSRLNTESKNHSLIITKHLEVLRMILAVGLRQGSKEMSQVIGELKVLASKR
jgi:two-component system chemotaxis response regulator CheY